MTPDPQTIDPAAMPVRERYAIDIEGDIGLPFVISSARAVDENAIDAILGCLAVAASGQAVLENVVYALRGLLAAAAARDLHGADPTELSRLFDAFRIAAIPVTDAVGGRLSDEDIFLSMGAASGFVQQVGTEPKARAEGGFIAAQVDRIALLADELDAIVRRRRIEADGDRFRRSLRILDAARAVPKAGEPLN